MGVPRGDSNPPKYENLTWAAEDEQGAASLKETPENATLAEAAGEEEKEN